MKVKDFARKYGFELPLYIRGVFVDREIKVSECWKVGSRVGAWKFYDGFDDADRTIRQIHANADGITIDVK